MRHPPAPTIRLPGTEDAEPLTAGFEALPSARFSSPTRYLVRMAVFLTLIGFIAFILYPAITTAFLTNPGLNGLIVGVLLVGIALALRQVQRLFREIRWARSARTPEGVKPARAPVLLAPMAAILRERGDDFSVTPTLLRSILDSLADRLDEGREILRYIAGLLVFLGLLGTFWGLLETVSSIGRVIGTLGTGGDAGSLFGELKSGLAAPLAGMGISFSSSLFGLAGSLVVGFLDLQAGQAQRRFYAEVEDWLAARTDASHGLEHAGSGGASEALAAAMNRLSAQLAGEGGRNNPSQAIANLAEGVQGLVQHMRSEQQMIRDWVEAQAVREKELKKLIEQLARERIG